MPMEIDTIYLRTDIKYMVRRQRRVIQILLTFLVLVVLLWIILLVGSALEMSNVNEADSTLYFYSTPNVCGVNASVPSMLTYPNASAASNAKSLVSHCGVCGFCSNFNDIDIYNYTKNTLTKTSTSCATKAFWGGSDAVKQCFKDNAGFTDDCNTCWTENVMCDMRSCVFTCLKMILTGQRNNDGKDGELNDCLLCDEKLCGPAFIDCAGANRRRSGIVSDIGRNEDKEICKKVNLAWQVPFRS